jgi:hypothetical protein
MQRWYDELGNPIWKESIDNLAEEPAQDPPDSTESGGSPSQLIPAAFERSAPPEAVPEAERLPPTYQRSIYVEGWGWATKPITATEGLRAVARVIKRRLEERNQ